MAIELFPFRYRDRLTGRWVRARYKATREEMAARYDEWEITGSVEIREPQNDGRSRRAHSWLRVGQLWGQHGVNVNSTPLNMDAVLPPDRKPSQMPPGSAQRRHSPCSTRSISSAP